MLLFALTLAWAAPASSSLSWVRLDGAEACVAAPELAAAVEARLGRPVFRAPGEATVAVEGRAERVTEGEARWRAVLRLTDHAGTVLGDRVVESRAEGCDELGQVVAVTLALMLDPLAPPEPEPPPAPASPPAPAPRAPAPGAPWEVEVHAALTGGYGLVPGVTLGGSATVLLTPPRFVPLVATGEVVPYGVDAAGTATFSRATGGLGLCPLDAAGQRVAVRGCVGVDAGAIVAIAPTEPLTGGERLLVQGRASARGSVRVWGPLVVTAAVHGIVPFRHVVFATTAGAEVYRPPPVAALADVGAGLRF